VGASASTSSPRLRDALGDLDGHDALDESPLGRVEAAGPIDVEPGEQLGARAQLVHAAGDLGGDGGIDHGAARSTGCEQTTGCGAGRHRVAPRPGSAAW